MRRNPRIGWQAARAGSGQKRRRGGHAVAVSHGLAARRAAYGVQPHMASSRGGTPRSHTRPRAAVGMPPVGIYGPKGGDPDCNPAQAGAGGHLAPSFLQTPAGAGLARRQDPTLPQAGMPRAFPQHAHAEAAGNYAGGFAAATFYETDGRAHPANRNVKARHPVGAPARRKAGPGARGEPDLLPPFTVQFAAGPNACPCRTCSVQDVDAPH